jgi:hypothetical protein
MVSDNLPVSFHFMSFLRFASIHYRKIQKHRFARRPATGRFLPLGELVQAGLSKLGVPRREACRRMKSGSEQQCRGWGRPGWGCVGFPDICPWRGGEVKALDWNTEVNGMWCGLGFWIWN